ncbi:sensor domain-containing diguanylate cyclase [Psychromonas ossibalaenae]|uniref:sensor domain-containing diguanylate cyclase n=1 Tax=Psychromonas ossibalaenae TaxID=444922 RepID=UPI00035F640E|nr:sensor domain-containing diguanylate cyclase [Psychromonas ossibalaenae]
MQKKSTGSPTRCRSYIKLLNLLIQQSDLEEQIKCALTINGFGTWSWDLKNNYIYLSDGLFTLTGTDKKHFDNSITYITEHIIHPDYKEKFTQIVEAKLHSGFIETSIFRVNHPCNEECWVRIIGEVITDGQGKPLRALGTILDITAEHIHNRELKSNLSFLKSLMEALPNPIFYKDNLGLYRFCNNAFLDYIGYTQDQVIGHSVYDVAPHDLADIYHKADLELMANKGQQVYDANVKYADGSIHDVIFNKATHVGDEGQVLGLVGIIQDVTEKKTTERQLQMLHKVKDILLELNHSVISYNNESEFFDVSLKQFQTLFEHCRISKVYKLDQENNLTVLACSGANAWHSPVKLEQSYLRSLVTKGLNHAYIANNLRPEETLLSAELNCGESHVLLRSSLVIPVTIDSKLMCIFSFDSNSNNSYSKNDIIIADYIGQQLPVVYRVFELYQKTLILSRYDSLTGLMNRGYFDTIVTDRLSVANRKNQTLVIITFDLDGLKSINDRHGHNAGDLYIQTFTRLLTRKFRISDAFARVGGDEFIGIFSDTDADTLKEKILELGSDFELHQMNAHGQSFSGSFSFGLADFPVDADNIAMLSKLSDERMYLDKKRKK